MALDPPPARTCTPGTPPPEVNWSTPLSPAQASCRAGRGGAGGTLTSGDVISALGERGSTLGRRPSLFVGGRGGGGGTAAPTVPGGDGGHLGRNQDGINQTLMSKAATPRG